MKKWDKRGFYRMFLYSLCGSCASLCTGESGGYGSGRRGKDS